MSHEDYTIKYDTIGRCVGILVRFEDDGKERFFGESMSPADAKALGQRLIDAAAAVQREIDKDGITYENAQRGLAEWAERERSQ